MNLESFISSKLELTGAFFLKLDRNFQRLVNWVNISPVAVSTNGYTFTENDRVGTVLVDTTSGNLTVYLPSTPTGNRRRTVVKTVAANVLIIDGNGATIYGPGGWAGGVSQAFLNGQWESLTFEPTGTAWVIVASVP